MPIETLSRGPGDSHEVPLSRPADEGLMIRAIDTGLDATLRGMENDRKIVRAGAEVAFYTLISAVKTVALTQEMKQGQH